MVGENDVLILVKITCIKNRHSKFQMLANKIEYVKTWCCFLLSNKILEHFLWWLCFEDYNSLKNTKWKSSLQKCQKLCNPEGKPTPDKSNKRLGRLLTFLKVRIKMLFQEKAMFFSIKDTTIDHKISCKTNYKGGYNY